MSGCAQFLVFCALGQKNNTIVFYTIIYWDYFVMDNDSNWDINTWLFFLVYLGVSQGIYKFEKWRVITMIYGKCDIWF